VIQGERARSLMMAGVIQSERRLIIAADVMFTNSLFSAFFRSGQVLETIRGGGIFQPAVDEAIKLVQNGEWVGDFFHWIHIHVFTRFAKWSVPSCSADQNPERVPTPFPSFEQMNRHVSLAFRTESMKLPLMLDTYLSRRKSQSKIDQSTWRSTTIQMGSVSALKFTS
jgi:hypothetical protein